MRNEFLNGKKAVLFDLDGTLVDSMWMWKDIDIEFWDGSDTVCRRISRGRSRA